MIIYNPNMHIKCKSINYKTTKGIDTSVRSFRRVFGFNEIEGLIYLWDGFYLRAVFSLTCHMSSLQFWKLTGVQFSIITFYHHCARQIFLCYAMVENKVSLITSFRVATSKAKVKIRISVYYWAGNFQSQINDLNTSTK